MTESIYQRDENLILKAAGAETSSTDGTGIAIGPTGLVMAVVKVTAVSGTNPTLDLAIAGSISLAGTYYDIVKAPQITAVGVYVVYFKTEYDYVRYESTIGGTGTPTFTYEIGICKP